MTEKTKAMTGFATSIWNIRAHPNPSKVYHKLCKEERAEWANFVVSSSQIRTISLSIVRSLVSPTQCRWGDSHFRETWHDPLQHGKQLQSNNIGQHAHNPQQQNCIQIYKISMMYPWVVWHTCVHPPRRRRAFPLLSVSSCWLPVSCFTAPGEGTRF